MDNKIIFNTKTFGKLEYVKTLVYYDHPLIFICKDLSNNLYLFNEIEDADIAEYWICDLKACNLKLADFYTETGELNYKVFKQLLYTISYKFSYKLLAPVSETKIKKYIT